MFDRVAKHHSMSAVVVEYAGNIGLTGKCDPCAAAINGCDAGPNIFGVAVFVLHR